MYKKIFLLLILAAFLLSGCNDGDSDVIVQVPASVVEIRDLNQIPEYSISEIGTIKPVQEVEIISKSSGTIDQVFAAIGQFVKSGQVLATVDFNSSDNTARINLDSVLSQYNNAQITSDEVRANSQSLVEQAELTVLNLESALSQLRRNLTELEDTNESTLASLELQLENAEVNVDSAQISYESMADQFQQSWDDYYASAEVSVDSIFNNALTNFETITNIINPSKKSTIVMSDVPSLLGARDASQKNETINTYNKTSSFIGQNEDVYLSEIELGEENIDEMLETARDLSVSVHNSLNAVQTLLINSATGSNLPEATLTAYQTSVNNAVSASSADIGVINQLIASYQSLKLSETTELSVAQNSLTVSKNQLSDAENALNTFLISDSSSEKDLENQIIQTENDLLVAKENLNSAKRNRSIQNEANDLEINTLGNQVKLAQKSLSDNKITSTIDGVVSEFSVDEGDYVSAGTYIGTVIRHEQVKIIFYVTEEIASGLSVNHPIEFSASGDSEKIFNGVISKISPSADSASKKILIEGLAYNTDLQLMPESFVNVQINVSEDFFSTNKIYIPLNSIIIGQDEQFVFVAEEGKAVRKDVIIGKIFDKWVEVESGLESSDQLIVEGHRNLVDGEEVQF